MNKQDQIKQYNDKTGYNITNTKNMTLDNIKLYGYGFNTKTSLQELYKNPSNEKITSYKLILDKYKPKEIIAVQGSCHSYSVLLQAENGDYLHITKSNNYLINIKE